LATEFTVKGVKCSLYSGMCCNTEQDADQGLGKATRPDQLLAPTNRKHTCDYTAE